MVFVFLLLISSLGMIISHCIHVAANDIISFFLWLSNIPLWLTQVTRVQSLGQEDALGKEMATHSSILAWRIPWTEKPGRLESMGSQRVGYD